LRYIPHIYQTHAEAHILDNDGCGLFIDMGLGKTVISLTAIDRLLFEECEVSRVLVIAPKRVAEHTWTAEVAKWDHLQHLKISKVLGSEKERKAALKAKADIYLINRENVVWLVNQYGVNWPFDMVVIDELSSFKSAKSARFKALRQIRPLIKRVVGLTGTPSPNGLLDLWSQLYLLDMGQRLGPTLIDYRKRFFRVENDYTPFKKYEVIREPDDLIGEGYYEKKIYAKIADICISMKAEDYLDLPEKIFNDIPVVFNSDTRRKYEEFERQQVLSLMSENEFGEVEITAVNAGVLQNKLLQFSNGAVYDEFREWHEVHDEKLESLGEIIDDANGKSLLIFYNYKHDRDRIVKRFKGCGIRELKSDKDIDDWNDGKINILLAHPASAGHGLNLQTGGNIIVFFGLLWSLELYLQAISRLHRQGQIHNVIVHRLIAAGTVESDVVVNVLDEKETGQAALMKFTRAMVVKHSKQYKKSA
jgi:SNF2 family DNA or RNA helicase